MFKELKNSVRKMSHQIANINKNRIYFLKNENKETGHQRPVGHHQAYHHTIMGFSKGHEWERGRKSI
jgi:hypothetical protein